MAENMYNSDHKATNKDYRDHYEDTFGKKCNHCGCSKPDTKCSKCFNVK